jgi:hypothetical protein
LGGQDGQLDVLGDPGAHSVFDRVQNGAGGRHVEGFHQLPEVRKKSYPIRKRQDGERFTLMTEQAQQRNQASVSVHIRKSNHHCLKNHCEIPHAITLIYMSPEKETTFE